MVCGLIGRESLPLTYCVCQYLSTISFFLLCYFLTFFSDNQELSQRTAEGHVSDRSQHNEVSWTSSGDMHRTWAKEAIIGLQIPSFQGEIDREIKSSFLKQWACGHLVDYVSTRRCVHINTASPASNPDTLTVSKTQWRSLPCYSAVELSEKWLDWVKISRELWYTDKPHLRIFLNVKPCQS